MNDAAPERTPASGSGRGAADTVDVGRARGRFLATVLDRPWHSGATLFLATAALVLSAISLLFPSSPAPSTRTRVAPANAPVATIAPSFPTSPSLPYLPAMTEREAAPEPTTPKPRPAPDHAESASAALHESPAELDLTANAAPAEPEDVEPAPRRAPVENEPLVAQETLVASSQGDAEALRGAARREILRAADETGTGDDAAEAWLYLSEIRRAAGDEAGAAQALGRRDAILAERQTRATFLAQLEAIRSSIDEKAFGTASHPILDPAPDGDYKRARVRLYSMLARSGDLSSSLGAIAPDVSMAIADTYRDEALRALEGRKADAPPPSARIEELSKDAETGARK